MRIYDRANKREIMWKIIFLVSLGYSLARGGKGHLVGYGFVRSGWCGSGETRLSLVAKSYVKEGCWKKSNVVTGVGALSGAKLRRIWAILLGLTVTLVSSGKESNLPDALYGYFSYSSFVLSLIKFIFPIKKK